MKEIEILLLFMPAEICDTGKLRMRHSLIVDHYTFADNIGFRGYFYGLSQSRLT